MWWFLALFVVAVICQDVWRYTSVQNSGVDLTKDWTKKYPLCGGDTQSPINIDTRKLRYDRNVCHGNLQLKFEDVLQFDMTEKQYGFNIVGEKKDFTTGLFNKITLSKESIGRFRNQFNPIKGVNENYCFHSLHFHWSNDNTGAKGGKGSEHVVNNKRYPLEAHFVHYSCDYKDISTAIAASSTAKDPYVLAVIGVLIEVGDRYNPAFRTVIENIKKINILNDGIKSTKITGLNLNDLLPWNFDFYGYQGSLTTPPCFPIVRWHLLKEPTFISVEQLRTMESLKMEYTVLNNEIQNFRPTVFNKNQVYGCGVSFEPGYSGPGYNTGTDQPGGTKSGSSNNNNLFVDSSNKISRLENEKNVVLGVFLAVLVLLIIFIGIIGYCCYNFQQEKAKENEKELDEISRSEKRKKRKERQRNRDDDRDEDYSDDRDDDRDDDSREARKSKKRRDRGDKDHDKDRDRRHKRKRKTDKDQFENVHSSSNLL